ncbi:adenosylcobinamide-GDP ribazoletransferase [Aeromonas salmonicida]
MIGKKLAAEWRLFLIAIGFFTRIPVPESVSVDTASLNRASRYFGMVGMLVGAAAALVLCGASFLLPAGAAVVLAIVVSVLLTGGFHEDGLADTADGLGGGWTLEQKLSIMKDSRLGSYGALTLMLALLMKWQLLTALLDHCVADAATALLLAHVLSRVVAASLIATETYVREEGKAKPLAHQQDRGELLVLLGTAVVAMLALAPGILLWLTLSLLLTRFVMVTLLRQQLGGYTGDTLGAVQQVSELTVYSLLWICGH